MQDKLKNWSEGHNQTVDSMHGLGGDMSDENVDEVTARRGIVLLTDCQYCGRQWKGIVPWPEVANYYLLEPMLASDGSPVVRYTRQGVLCVMPCNGCHKKFQVVTEYDEVRKWVNTGVRTGALSPKIYEAARAKGIRH